MLPIHLALASGDHDMHIHSDSMENRVEETAPSADLEPHSQHHGRDPHSPSGLTQTLVANISRQSQTAKDGTDVSERHVRTRIAQSDWNIYRDVIVYLYRDCMQPLNRVKETMEREYGFFATERMYKHRFKQWRMFKYAKQSGVSSQRHHDEDDEDDKDDKDDKATRLRPPEAMVLLHQPKSASPVTIPTPLMLPDSLRDLGVCMNHLHAFIQATCGNSRKRPRTVDPSPEMALNRSSWCFSVNNAVVQIHQGRLATGFRLLDATFNEFRRNRYAQDTGFLVRLVACLCLFADDGLPGLMATFLQYAYHILCLELSAVHPLAIATRQIQVTVLKDRRLDAAWDLVARYSELLWQYSDPSPEGPPPSEAIPGLTELSWDLSRAVDRDFIAPLAVPSQTLGWASSSFSVSMSVAQLQLTQRTYGTARRVVEDLITHLDPAAEPVDLALAYRKRWQISRAEDRHARSCDDARTYVDFCRTSLGPDHYMTARAVCDYEDYLSELRDARNLDTKAGAYSLGETASSPYVQEDEEIRPDFYQN